MLNDKMLGLIHASSISIAMCQPFIDEYIPEVAVMHFADDTVQRDNLLAPVGALPKKNFGKFALYSKILQNSGADMVLLACSTFNEAVEFAQPMIDIPIWQIDGPMVEMVVSDSKKVGILGTLPSAVYAEERLINLSAGKRNRKIELVKEVHRDAFEVLLTGDREKHNAMLIDSLYNMAKEVDCIVLAQISMAILEPFTKDVPVPVYNSGRTCFPALRKFLSEM